MQLLSVTVTGFKQFAELRTFEFGAGHNIIQGDNNTGKTTIAEAVTYAFWGVDLAGSDKVDHLMNVNSKSMDITVKFRIGEAMHELIRTRDTGKKTSFTEAYLDGQQVSKADIAALIGDQRHFMAVFIPTYIHGLTDDKASELLRSLIRPVTSEEVLASLVEEHREALKYIKLLDPAGEQKKLRVEIKDIEADTQRLYGQIEVLDKTINQQIPQPLASYADTIAALEEKISAIKATESKPIDVAPMKASYERMKRDFTRLKGMIKPIPPVPEYTDDTPCPTCGQQLPLTSFAKVLEAHERQVEEVTAHNKQIQSQLVQLTEDAKKLVAEIDAAEKANASRPFVDNTEINKLTAELGFYKSEEAKVADNNRRRDFITGQIEEAKASKDKVQASITANNKDIPRLKLQIEALGEFINTRERLMMEQIRQHLIKTDITLFKLVKSTGELKPDFNLTYDGQPYKTMSNSNRIRCGLEIAAMITKLTGRQYPVYIDNAEAISAFEPPEGQYFTAAVTPGAALTIVQ